MGAVKCNVDLKDCRGVQRFSFDTRLECFKHVVFFPGHKITAKDTGQKFLTIWLLMGMGRENSLLKEI